MRTDWLENSTFCAMTEEYARQISQWAYPPPYEAYSFAGHPNGYLFDEASWGNEQFCLVCDGTVVGQVACQKDGNDLWVGWALCPALCGRGNGAAFVSRCITALRGAKAHAGTVLLRVAASNERAVRAYGKAGFSYVKTIPDEIAYTGRTEDFLVMAHDGRKEMEEEK